MERCLSENELVVTILESKIKLGYKLLNKYPQILF